MIKHVATGMVLQGISTFTLIKVGYMKAVIITFIEALM